jgi:hypothetical protein
MQLNAAPDGSLLASGFGIGGGDPSCSMIARSKDFRTDLLVKLQDLYRKCPVLKSIQDKTLHLNEAGGRTTLIHTIVTFQIK